MVTLKQIIAFLDKKQHKYTLLGKDDLTIEGPSSLNNLRPHSIAWVKEQSYYATGLLDELRDVLFIVKAEIEVEYDDGDLAFIKCDNPKEIFFSILENFFEVTKYPAFVAATSIVEGKIGNDVYIGHHCYVGPNVVIGDNVVIKNNVSLEGRVQIGHNTIIHSGVKIGTDGYGYYRDRYGKNIKVPHYGGVIIGNDVEVGANTCIDKGTLDDTFIGNNVKIDNLCHIGHNCIIGDNCSVVAMTMLGGSAAIEKNAYVAPGVMVRNQLKIGENSLLGMGAVVVKDVEPGKVVAGVPAKVIRDNL